MNTYQNFTHWVHERHAPIWMDVVRVVIGIFLFAKGLIFTSNFPGLTQNIQEMGFVYLAVIAGHYIYLMHMAGGLLIILGAHTRVFCALNIPILAGAVAFNAMHYMTVDGLMELEVAIATLFGLFVLLIFGSGEFSLDEMQRRRDLKKRASKLH